MADSYSWGPVPVSPEEIEAYLAQLWARDPLSGASRLCTTNLLVFLKDKEQEEQTHQILAKLVASNPGRVVVIVPVDGLQQLKAYVSAKCELPAERSSMVCCDQVLLEADRSLMASVVSIVSEVLVPGLPVFIWWRGDPTDVADRAVASLKGLVNRVIFDSQEFSSPRSFRNARRMAMELGCPLGDINWNRLAPWRAAATAALTAEEASVARREFGALRFALAEPGNFSQPLLLGSWIAALLGLVPVGVQRQGDGLSILTQEGRYLTVTWQKEASPKLPLGSLVEMELTGADHNLTIRRTDDGACLECSATVHGRNWHSAIACVDLPLDQLLSLELAQFGSDGELEMCLDLMLQLLEFLGD